MDKNELDTEIKLILNLNELMIHIQDILRPQKIFFSYLSSMKAVQIFAGNTHAYIGTVSFIDFFKKYKKVY